MPIIQHSPFFLPLGLSSSSLSLFFFLGLSSRNTCSLLLTTINWFPLFLKDGFTLQGLSPLSQVLFLCIRKNMILFICVPTIIYPRWIPVTNRSIRYIYTDTWNISFKLYSFPLALSQLHRFTSIAYAAVSSKLFW